MQYDRLKYECPTCKAIIGEQCSTPDGTEYAQQTYFHKDRGHAFEYAKFYDWRDDGETLSFSAPEEALEDWLQYHWVKDQTVRETIGMSGPAEVSAWVVKEIPEDWAEHRVDCALDTFDETFLEEFGGPDGEGGFTTKAMNALKEKLLPHVQEFLKNEQVWQCDIVAKRKYSIDELFAMAEKEGWN